MIMLKKYAPPPEVFSVKGFLAMFCKETPRIIDISKTAFMVFSIVKIHIIVYIQKGTFAIKIREKILSFLPDCGIIGADKCKRR